MRGEEHVVEKVAGRDFQNISSNARGKMVDASTEQKVMKGETVRIEFDDEELLEKTKKRFISPLIMAIGHSPDILGSRKLREKIWSGTLNPIEYEMILASIRK